MTTFSTDIIIEAPIAIVWEILADIGSISVWNPGVVKSHATNTTQGLGASRHCNLGGNNFLDEDVVQWEPEKRLTMRITKTNMPFKTADIHFTLQPQGDNSTHVTVSPEYELKFGPIGKLLDVLMVRKTYTKGMKSLLQGLKKHAEGQKLS